MKEEKAKARGKTKADVNVANAGKDGRVATTSGGSSGEAQG